jgi:hypothetical protein
LVEFSPEGLQCRLHGMPPFSHVRPTCGFSRGG